MFKADKLTPRQMKALAEDHIQMYTRRLEVGEKEPMGRGRFVNVSLCKKYHFIWTSVRTKAVVALEAGAEVFPVDDLTPQELSEVRDALFEGSYDNLLRGAGTN